MCKRAYILGSLIVEHQNTLVGLHIALQDRDSRAKLAACRGHDMCAEILLRLDEGMLCVFCCAYSY